MKKFTLCLIILMILIACKDSKKSNTEKNQKYIYKGQKWEERIGKEIGKFNGELIILYKYANDNPEKGIARVDSFLIANEEEKDLYRSEIKSNIRDKLDYLKAEMLYKLGRYNESLEILNKSEYKHGDHALATAANYTKLGQHELAKSFVDSIYKGYYIYDYALGNYYESINDTNNALKVYYDIEKDKQIKHYVYYKLALERIKELQKSKPSLLNELYFPTGDPSFDIADSDSKNRNRIFEMIDNIPECKHHNVHIFEEPQINDKDYYWIKVSENNESLDHLNSNKSYKAKYDFFIYPKNFEIKYYDEERNVLLSLEEWRTKKNKL